jgi:hypothetical protein
VKTKAYWNKFDNSIISYDDPWLATQTTTKSFNSRYTDYALGGSVEAGTEIAGVDTLKALLDYRFDTARGRNMMGGTHSAAPRRAMAASPTSCASRSR